MNKLETCPFEEPAGQYEIVPEKKKKTRFEKITESPTALAEYLSNISTMPVCEIIGYCDKCPLNEKCQEEPLGDGDQYEVWLAWLEQECKE